MRSTQGQSYDLIELPKFGDLIGCDHVEFVDVYGSQRGRTTNRMGKFAVFVVTRSGLKRTVSSSWHATSVGSLFASLATNTSGARATRPAPSATPVTSVTKVGFHVPLIFNLDNLKMMKINGYIVYSVL